MKKILVLLSTIVSGVVLFTSCDINSYPKFDDKDAYVAFYTGSVNVNENAGTVKIPVYLVSLKGLSSTATYEVVDGTAKKGINYNSLGNTLNFTGGDGDTQYIEIQIVNKPSVYTGNLNFRIDLTDAGSVNLGARKSFSVTIVDLDHPLVQFAGNWQAVADGAAGWNVKVTTDKTNRDMVWFQSMFEMTGIADIYGISNATKTEIRVQVGQTVKVGEDDEEAGTTAIEYTLVAWDSDGEEITEGGNIIFEVNDDSTEMSFNGRYGLQDKDGNLVASVENVTLTKGE